MIIKVFVIDWHSHTKFRERRGVWGSENVYIFEALGLNFWRFLKRFRKQIACKLTVFHKNNYFITQILPENVKILTWVLHDFSWISQ
jgi:hypothetical protein